MILYILTPNLPAYPWLGLAGWLLLCFAASGTAIFVTRSGWYADLHKPSWDPPAWLFGPAWTLLYAMMAVAAWLVWRDGGWSAHRVALGLFLGQWLLNLWWTPVFFGMRRPGLALLDLLGLVIVLAATLVAFWRISLPAGLLLVPYLAWVCFAAMLNLTIWRLNPSGRGIPGARHSFDTPA